VSDLPLCQCGCGRRVKKLFIRRPNGVRTRVRFYDRTCYTTSGVRGQRTREANAKAAYARRRQRFQRYLERLGQTFTQEDLVAVFQEIATYYQSLGRERRAPWRHVA
jgi:hypothetical protein